MLVEIKRDRDDINNIKDRLASSARFERCDRVPTIAWIDTRYWLPRLGLTFEEYFADPITQIRAQVLGQKWAIENLGDDRVTFKGSAGSHACGRYSEEELAIYVMPDFQIIEEPSAYGCAIYWRKNDVPCVASPSVNSTSDIEKVEKMDPQTDGFLGKALQFYHEMVKEAEKITIKMGGETFHPTPVIGRADGPFTVASLIRGQQTIMVDILRNPDFVHKLVQLVAQHQIEWIKMGKELCGLPEDGIWFFDDDYAPYLSPKLFREFAMPYERMIYEAIGGLRPMHMCGDTNHLLEILVDDLKITSFEGFGYSVDLQKLARIMGGKIHLRGNLNPTTVAYGTREEIMEECRKRIEILGPCSGFILSDGANLPPDTPVENVRAMVRASELYSPKKLTLDIRE